jgi:hypothetical protein
MSAISPDSASNPPLSVAIDLPIDDGAWNILKKCSLSYLLSGIISYPNPIGNRLARANFKVKQDKANYLGLIDCIVEINLWCLSQWSFPSLYDSRVLYASEPWGQEVFQTVPALYLRGLGDCEDLVAARVSELRNHGYYAKANMSQSGRSPSGGRLFHFTVLHENGSIEDPSRLLGM